MKVFGFDDTGVMRGEMLAAKVDAGDMRFPGMTRRELGWEFVSSKFSEARGELLNRMYDEGVDDEMIKTVRSLKASWVPVEGQ